MIEEKDAKKFLGKNVIVGVPHTTEPRPFYVTGEVTEIRNGRLILEFPLGFKEIDLREIIEIRIKGGR